MGMDVTVLPTTLFGRHPGWGAPGGEVVPTEKLTAMWEAVHAQIKDRGLPVDAIMTGYMGEVGHVELAANIIDTIKPPRVLVDPVMGDGSRDKGGLYISKDRAEAICDHLIPRAHIATPNLWEWRYITGNLSEPDHVRPRPLAGTEETLVTSVSTHNADDPSQIGAMLFESGQTHSVFHDRYDTVPNGGGDTLAAAYLGQRLRGDNPHDALAHSVASVFAIMGATEPNDCGELPLIRAQKFLDVDGGAPELTVETDHD
jgi:pyridoxine kinase